MLSTQIANFGSPSAQFMAGLIYEFTGDNQLTEIESCYNGSQQLVTDLETEINLIEAGDMVKAAKLMIQIR